MRIFAIVLAFIASVAGPSVAGTTGVLSGFVRSEFGKPVAGASIIIVSSTNLVRTKTNEHGYFALIDMAPDDYMFSIDREGYSPYSLHVRVNSDQTSSLQLTMFGQGRCGGDFYPTQSADQSGDDFYSFDLRANASYPLSMILPIAKPGPGINRVGRCL